MSAGLTRGQIEGIAVVRHEAKRRLAQGKNARTALINQHIIDYLARSVLWLADEFDHVLREVPSDPPETTSFDSETINKKAGM